MALNKASRDQVDETLSASQSLAATRRRSIQQCGWSDVGVISGEYHMSHDAVVMLVAHAPATTTPAATIALSMSISFNIIRC